MADPKLANEVRSRLLDYARKIASEKQAAGEGAPDRMTAGDGEGGVDTMQGSRPHDVGEDEVKRDLPSDGDVRNSKEVPEGGPDRMTAGDGDGGMSCGKDSRPDDPGEAEVKEDLPADGDVRKSANDRIEKIRQALLKNRPGMAKKAEQETGDKEEADDPSAEKSADDKAKDSPEEEPLKFSADTLAKIASQILSTEEGIRFVHDTFEKQAGEDAARRQIQEALECAQSYDVTEQIKEAALNDFEQKAAGIEADLLAKGITEEDAHEILKQAALHQEALTSYETDLEKAAYAQGAEDAALMAAADEAAGEEGVPPVDEAIPMGGESLSEEEIMALLEEMIASGEISEEDVLAALEAEGAAEAVPASAEAVPASA